MALSLRERGAVADRAEEGSRFGRLEIAVERCVWAGNEVRRVCALV